MAALAKRPDRHPWKAAPWTVVLTVLLLPLPGPPPAVGAAAGAAADPACLPGPSGGLGDTPWVIPCALPETTTQESFYEFMWQTFVAINWPSTGKRGEPDLDGDLPDDRPDAFRVWETWPGPLEIFLPPACFADYQVDSERVQVRGGPTPEESGLKCEVMGLVALHILRYTPPPAPCLPPRRVATTFEQVDNVELPPDAPAGLTPSFNDGLPSGAVERVLGFKSPSAENSGRVPAPICANEEKCRSPASTRTPTTSSTPRSSPTRSAT